MKKIFIIAVACVALAACTRSGLDNQKNGVYFEKGQKVTLTVANGETKVVGAWNASGSTVDFTWETGDKIAVKVGSDTAHFKLVEGAGEKSGKFEGEMPGSGDSYDVEYPATGAPDITTQEYAANALPKNKMFAKQTGCVLNENFALTPQNAALKFNFLGESTVGKVVVTDSVATYTLNCAPGVAVGATPIPFFIIVPVGICHYTVELFDNSDPAKKISEFTKTSNGKTAENKVANMPAKCVEENGYVEDDKYYGKGTQINGIIWAPVNCGYSTDKFGLLYQWGRKYGQKYTPDPTKEELSSQLTVHPDGSGTANAGKFYKYSNSTFWYNGPNPYQLWNTSEGTSNPTSKSSYDPCPEGWRVPTIAEFELLVGGSATIGELKKVEDGGVDLWGHWFNGTSTADNPEGQGVFLPASGYRGEDFVAKDRYQATAKYWSSGVNGEHPNYLLFDAREDVKKAYVGGGGLAMDGYPVRCVRNKTYTDISKGGKTANSYIVTEAGDYMFKATQGNSTTAISGIKSVKVLWETFGTSTAPSVGDLIKTDVKCADNYICFSATDKKGNALIAAYDGANGTGNILWSWHIWLTAQPAEQVYKNGAGTLMDRNLGATSKDPGSVGALGLLYQWGRKDPFLSGNDISSNTTAASTLSWPVNQESKDVGTIEYAVKNPTTFITFNSNNTDWYYSSTAEVTDNTRWQSEKTIYDPCPYGWQVPEGGNGGVWAIAMGTSLTTKYTFDNENRGIDFGSTNPVMGVGTIWYPLAGKRDYDKGVLQTTVGDYGNYWSCTPKDKTAYGFDIDKDGDAIFADGAGRADARSVRCMKIQPVPHYIDEKGIDRGEGTKINGVIWAPVNCGYSEDYPYGKMYQWGRYDGGGYTGEKNIQTATYGVVSDPGSDKFYYGGSDWYYGSATITMWPKESQDPGYLASKIDNPCPKGWRVPTYDECNNLVTITRKWETNKDATGKGSGNMSGELFGTEPNQIFLPAAGWRNYQDAGLLNRNEYGDYWTSVVASSSSSKASIINFSSAYLAKIIDYEKGCGFSVRCVYDAKTAGVTAGSFDDRTSW